MDWPILFLIGFLLWIGFEQGASLGQDQVPRVCVVLGAPGEPLYGDMFQQWAQSWSESSQGTTVQWIGPVNPAQVSPAQVSPAQVSPAQLGVVESLILRFQKNRQLLLDALGGIRIGFRDASE